MASTDQTATKIAAFYAAQAHYYNLTYESPHADEKYVRLRKRYRQLFSGLDVLEIACGTGYWTEIVSATANTILATDINENLVAMARERTRSLANVRCEVASAYSLHGVDRSFSGAFAQYWLSHVPKQLLSPFLENLHSRLNPGARLFFSDDTFYFHETIKRRTDAHGDIYEERVGPDGTRGETIKNFPAADELRSLVENIAEDIEYEEYQPEGLWTFSYRLR